MKLILVNGAKSTEIEVNETTRIVNFRALVAVAFHVQVENIFELRTESGVLMKQDDKTLEAYGVKDGSTIFIGITGVEDDEDETDKTGELTSGIDFGDLEDTVKELDKRSDAYLDGASMTVEFGEGESQLSKLSVSKISTSGTVPQTVSESKPLSQKMKRKAKKKEKKKGNTVFDNDEEEEFTVVVDAVGQRLESKNDSISIIVPEVIAPKPSIPAPSNSSSPPPGASSFIEGKGNELLQSKVEVLSSELDDTNSEMEDARNDMEEEVSSKMEDMSNEIELVEQQESALKEEQQQKVNEEIKNDVQLDNAVKQVALPNDAPQSSSLAYFSAFAPPIVESGDSFLLNIWAYCKEEHDQVIRVEQSKGNTEAGMKGPLRIMIGTTVVVELEMPKDSFQYDKTGSINWEGVASNCSFGIKCLQKASAGAKICRAKIMINEIERAVLLFKVDVQRPPAIGCMGMILRACCGDQPGQKTDQLNLIAHSGNKTKAIDPSAKDLDAKLTLLPRSKAPHIFLSYRRTHIDLADRVRRVLQGYGYQCFLDLSLESGLEAGVFTDQLKSKLDAAAVVVPILTPAPSGTDEIRSKLSSLGCVKDSVKHGKVDWCFEELKMCLPRKDKIILPVFKGVDLSEEFQDLPKSIERLKELNCRQLHDDLFDASVDVLHKFIQKKLASIEATE